MDFRSETSWRYLFSNRVVSQLKEDLLLPPPLSWERRTLWSRTRAWTLTKACMHRSVIVACLLTLWPLTRACSLTSPFNALRALLALEIQIRADRIKEWKRSNVYIHRERERERDAPDTPGIPFGWAPPHCARGHMSAKEVAKYRVLLHEWAVRVLWHFDSLFVAMKATKASGKATFSSPFSEDGVKHESERRNEINRDLETCWFVAQCYLLRIIQFSLAAAGWFLLRILGWRTESSLHRRQPRASSFLPHACRRGRKKIAVKEDLNTK